MPPADDLYEDTDNDIDDGRIPPDLYGEPEPDEEVAETAYDYKNDYDQAQDSNAEQAGGLSWWVKAKLLIILVSRAASESNSIRLILN